MLRTTFVVSFVFLGSWLLVGCGGGGAVTLSLATARAPRAALVSGIISAVPENGRLTLSDGSHTLTLTGVSLVLREIEIDREDEGVEETCGESEDACEELELGPMVVDVPLDGSAQAAISADVPEGMYDEIEFDIHKLEGGSDAAVIAERPEMDGLSVRAAGTFDGSDFLFESSLDVEQELEAPFEVAGGPVNLTLAVDLSLWFDDGSGALLDPRGGAQSAIENSIKASFKGFEDDDQDGEDDSQD